MITFKRIFRVRVIKASLLPQLLGVDAITLYPLIFTAEESPDDILLNHEFLHVKQVETFGWFQFYLAYLMYYCAGRLSGLDHDDAYQKIPFEEVAYEQEDHPSLIGERIQRGIV